MSDRNPSGKPDDPVTIKVNQKPYVKLTFVDNNGNPVSTGLKIIWKSSDTSLLTVEPSSNQLSATVTTFGQHGEVLLSAVDINSGVGCHTLINIVSESSNMVP